MIAALSGVVKADDDTDDVFTHCGIIFKDGEKLNVYEGAGRGELLTLAKWQERESDGTVGKIVDGKVVRDAKKQPLHNVYAMRWNPQTELAAGLDRLLKKAEELHKTNYDKGFSWSDKYEFAYCSELVWKAFEAGGLVLGKLPTLGDYVKAVAVKQPGVANDIKAKLEQAKKAKYRDDYEESEWAVSPEDVFRSPHLIPVTDASP